MSGLIDVVEGVEKFVLGLLFAGNKLDIVHQKQVHIAVFLAEFLRCAVLNGFDQLIGELIPLDVGNAFFRALFMDLLPNGQKKMGLSQAGVAVDKQGVIGLARIFRHGDGGSVGKLVGAAHDEAIKGIARHFRQGAVHLFLDGKIIDLIPGEDQQIKVTGEQVGQGGLDGIAEAGADNAPFKIGGGMQHQAAVLNIHRGTIGKPGINGSGGELM